MLWAVGGNAGDGVITGYPYGETAAFTAYGEQLPYLRELVTHLHVAVHDALPDLLAEEVPLGGLRERVDDEVARALALEEVVVDVHV